MISPFTVTIVATLVVGFAAQIAGLAFPLVAVLAVAAGLIADALARRHMQG